MKDRLWGGEKLKKLFDKPSETDTTGESWELSEVEGDVSIVANGHLAGESLQELISHHAFELIGKHVVQRFGKVFPILVKFIDAKQDLSIQLHPNEKLAKERHNSFGKTEMWHILDADPNARLIIGFNRNVSKEEYTKSLQENTLLSLLNYETVKPGDTFFINAGKIHAIGAGVLLVEIQQTSDVTYRVFDFNREDKYGNLRELHTELAVDAMDFHRNDDFKIAYSSKENRVNGMVDCPFFKTNFLNLTQSLVKDVASSDSFTIYICVAGDASISNEWGTTPIQKGETLLLAAASKRIEINTKSAKFLEVTISS